MGFIVGLLPTQAKKLLCVVITKWEYVKRIQIEVNFLSVCDYSDVID